MQPGRNHIDRVTTLFGAALLGVACVAPGGCASSARPRPATAPAQLGPAQRVEEAWKLAEQAERERKRGKLTEAAALYRQSVATSPDIAAVWNNYAATLYELNDRLNAVQAFNRAAEAEPTDPRPFENIGHIYFEIGWAEEALRYYERSLAISPTHLAALRGAIRAAEAIGRAEEVDLDRIRTGLLSETDPVWRTYFERQQPLFRTRLEKNREELNRSESASFTPNR